MESLFLFLCNTMYRVSKMKKRISLFIRRQPAGFSIAFIVISAFFICGIVAGAVSAGFVDNVQTLRDYMDSLLGVEASGSGFELKFITVFLSLLRGTIISFLFGFSILGIFCIPVVSLARGFLVSFSISVIVRLYGSEAILLVFSLFVMDIFVAMPCFLYISANSVCASKSLLQLSTGTEYPAYLHPYGKEFFIRFIVSTVIILAAAFAETYVMIYLARLAISVI